MRKFIVAAMIGIASIGPAHAWGDREQGALAGIAATLLFQHVQRANQQYPNGQPPVVVGQGPVIVQQPSYPVVTTQRHYCFSRPVLFDPYTGRPTHYTQECRFY